MQHLRDLIGQAVVHIFLKSVNTTKHLRYPKINFYKQMYFDNYKKHKKSIFNCFYANKNIFIVQQFTLFHEKNPQNLS